MRSQKSPLAELLSKTDQELASQAIHDGSAFTELYHRHFLGVYRYLAAASGSAAEAQELTTQTFAAALEGIRVYRGKPDFVGWLFGIALNQAALHRRAHSQEAPNESTEDILDRAASPERPGGAGLQFAQMSQALERLPPKQAEAIRLYLVAGLNAAETAQTLQTSPVVVKALVLYGLRDLRRELPSSQETER